MYIKGKKILSVVNTLGVVADKTLTEEGAAAEAKTTGEKIRANENKIKAIMGGLKSHFAVAEIENTAESRQTADGETNGITIVDGSYTVVKKIQGNTVVSGNKFVNAKFKGIKSTTALSYEPYTESVMTLPQTVELGKWDYIQDGKIVKHTEIETFTGSSSWTVNTTDYGIFFATTPKKGKVGMASTLVSNIFPNRWANEGLPCMYSPKDTIVVFPNADKDNPTITTIEQWGNYLAELKSKGTPLTVAYPLATPTETDITANFEYQVWDKGQEIMQVENAEAIPTVTNDYYILVEAE